VTRRGIDLLSVLALAVAIWFVYAVVEMASRLDVWPF